MLIQVLAATSNKGKLAELRAILSEFGVEVVSPADLSLDLEVEESGATFAENALIKARAYREASGMAVIADDSGLAVDALGGMPGVRTARYAGEGATDRENYEKLLAELAEVDEGARGAAFVCAAAFADLEGRELVALGELRGRIAFAPRGEGGFGYDPIFELPSTGRTLAETPAGEKNLISHRAVALAGLRERLGAVFGGNG